MLKVDDKAFGRSGWNLSEVAREVADACGARGAARLVMPDTEFEALQHSCEVVLPPEFRVSALQALTQSVVAEGEQRGMQIRLTDGHIKEKFSRPHDRHQNGYESLVDCRIHNWVFEFTSKETNAENPGVG